MISDKLSLTLFDILGYLLPGFVTLFALSLLEATFSNTSLLTLTILGNNLFLFSIIAYYLGHLCHIVATIIKDTFYEIFNPVSDTKKKNGRLGKFNQMIYHYFNHKEKRLSKPLFNRFRQVIQETYQIPLDQDEKLSTLENYLLADSYILASGCETERNSLMVREGFFKSSTISFAFIAMTTWVSILVGGLKIQVDAIQIYVLGNGLTIVIAIIISLLVCLFRNRFNYFNRMKLNNTYLLFLAYREKDMTTGA